MLENGLFENGTDAFTPVFDEGSSIYAILPLYTKEDAEKAAESLEPKKIASVDGRKIDGSVLIEETRF